MTTRIAHAGHEIVILDEGQTIIANQCEPGDAVIAKEGAGYCVSFVGKRGEVDGWAAAFGTLEEAISAAKYVIPDRP